MPKLDLSRRGFLRLLGVAAAGTALPACGSAATPTPGKEDAHAPAKGEAGHGGDAHGARAKELWQKGGGDDPLKGRTFQGLFNAIPERLRAFELKDTFLRCIDEGCPGGIH